MSIDNSRFTFEPWRDFLGVLMQQGRVQLDSDWNEWIAELDRRLRAGTLDAIGRAVVPSDTPDAFDIQFTAGKLTIGRGRMYVDGLLAENHGALPVPWDSAIAKKQKEDGLPVTEWDTVLVELRAQGAVAYDRQPYYPHAPEIPKKGGGLVYLDVWQREVTWLEEPDLIEKAVGVDTTARLQTVWQVKTLALPEGAKVSCATPDEKIPGWVEETASSAGRLSARAQEVKGKPDPCIIPPGGGYKGLENQLYRVEIHEDGAPKSANSKMFASFKWSRDNASVATRILTIQDGRSQLVVESTGKDDVLRFSDGDWVEITDDWLELNNLPGEIRRIATPEGVDDATRTITLEAPLTAGVFPVNAHNEPDPARHTRIRRWDQKGEVIKINHQGHASPWFDLDAATSKGVIPVPPAGTSLLLENGIVVSFDLDPAGGMFKSGDCWAFAARTADASIELLHKVPPRAIHHHYAKLAVVAFPDERLYDCRVPWPPAQTAGKGCDCSICVTPEGHNSGAATLQEAVNALAKSGGTICLDAGIYLLREPLRIAGAHSVRLRGLGPKTILVTENDVAIAIESSSNVTLENFAVFGSASEKGVGLIAISSSRFSALSGLALMAPPSREGARASLTLAGLVMELGVKHCLMMSDVGIATGGNKDVAPVAMEAKANQLDYLVSAGLDISDNLLLCFRRGVNFTGFTLHFLETRIAGNLVFGCRDSGLTATGAVLRGSSLNVVGNTLGVYGSGIVIGTDGARISDNEISFMGRVQSGDGIVLAPGLDPGGVDFCQVIGNRIFAATPKPNDGGKLDGAGRGIVLSTRVHSAMIKQNVISGVAAGIVMERKSSAGYLSIENNQLLDIAAGPGGEQAPLSAITIFAAARVDIVNNLLNRFARQVVESPRRVALQAVASSEIRILGNRFHGIGPMGNFREGTVAVEILGPFTRADVCDNVMTRAADGTDQPGQEGNWQALRVGPMAQEHSPTSGSAITYAEHGDTGALFTPTNVYSFAILRGEFTAHGNHMQSSGGVVPLVEVAGVETCLFSDNYCVKALSSRSPVVLMLNANFSVSGNRLRGDQGTTTMQIENGIATVIGNFTTGDILLDGQSIFAKEPWKSLNIRT